MKRGPLLGLLLLGAGLAGCSVGKGVGAASGVLFEYGCTKNSDYCSAPGVCGTEGNPLPFDLHPSYFAGEPIDDLREYTGGTEIMNNRVIIRLQRSGKQIELNDALSFDVVSSYEVARCVRGRVDPTTGLDDWDPNNCYRAYDDGPGRVRIQYDSVVHAALVLKSTCTADLVASAVSAPVPPSYTTAPKSTVTDGSWDSWVEFQDFGSAAQYDRAPTDRDPVDPKFRIGLGDRIYATSFFLTLVDDSVVQAAINSQPRMQAEIGGTLGGDPTTGRFDFDLQRGQGAQFFP